MVMCPEVLGRFGDPSNRTAPIAYRQEGTIRSSRQNGCVAILIPLQAGKGNLLKIVEQPIDLLAARMVVRMKSNDSTRVAMDLVHAVDKPADQLRVAPQNRNRGPFAPQMVLPAQQVSDGFCAATRAVIHELYVHARPAEIAICSTPRSILSRHVSTSIDSGVTPFAENSLTRLAI